MEAGNKMTDDRIVHLVDSLDNLGSALPVSISELDSKTNYAVLACRPCGTPSARYHPRPRELLATTLTGLPEGEILYVAPVRGKK